MENFDCFQILEYIRSSIEIIMNLKIEDLEKNDGGKKNLLSATTSQITANENAHEETSIDGISIESKNLIQQSMKDALLHMIDTNQGASNPKSRKEGPPTTYEKIIQKLEADIRGHIRLEHEMKIHMDYLEGKIEKIEKDQTQKDELVAKQQRQIESFNDKIKLLRGDRDEKDGIAKKFKKLNETLSLKLQDLQQKNETLTAKIELSFNSQ